MGYPSTLEAIFERLADAAHMAEADPSFATGPIAEERGRELAELLPRAEYMVAELRTWLNLATDPNVALAHALAEARDATAAEEARVTSYERSCKSLMVALDQQRKLTADLKTRLEAVTREKNAIEGKLEIALRNDPGAVYDAYAPKKKTLKAKRGSGNAL